ncbi:MAG: carbohydrate-binding domain-containing protein [Candidatus Woesearchaeota archaeon]
MNEIEAPRYWKKSKTTQPKKKSLWKRLTEEAPQKTPEELEKEENTLYNAIIFSLAIGIVIVIVTLIIARPAPEYFTELYFQNHTNLPKMITEGQLQTYTFSIHNLENGSFTYEVRIFAEITEGNQTQQDFDNYENITVKKGELMNKTVSFSINKTFLKAKITTEIMNKDQEIHFFAYNKEVVMPYQDFIGRIDCLSEINITKAAYFTVYASGTINPNMSIYLNGTRIYTATVHNNSNYTVAHEIGSGIMDMGFDNDYYNPEKNEDRNLYVQYIQIGETRINPDQGVLDSGEGRASFDCENTMQGKTDMYSNSALRFKLREK